MVFDIPLSQIVNQKCQMENFFLLDGLIHFAQGAWVLCKLRGTPDCE